MKEVAKKLPQYDFKFVPTSNDDLLIGVESGKYTVGTKGIWITEPRKKKIYFPEEQYWCQCDWPDCPQGEYR